MGATKILLVEDTPLNMELCVDLLEAGGYAVCCAETAEEGIALAGSEQPSLILMDIGLPGMDGLSATKALKANAQTRDIPVVALTAHAMKGDEENALAAGCAGYLTKPIDTQAFVSQVAAYLPASP